MLHWLICLSRNSKIVFVFRCLQYREHSRSFRTKKKKKTRPESLSSHTFVTCECLRKIISVRFDVDFAIACLSHYIYIIPYIQWTYVHTEHNYSSHSLDSVQVHYWNWLKWKRKNINIIHHKWIKVHAGPKAEEKKLFCALNKIRVTLHLRWPWWIVCEDIVTCYYNLNNS